MPNLEQIAAQYSRSRFPRHPYDRARYEQGFKDGVNSVLENEDVNDLVIDACRNEISRLKSQLYSNEQKIQLDLTKEELSLLDDLTYHECHKIENLYEERSPKMETMNKLRSKVIDLIQKNRDKISSTF